MIPPGQGCKLREYYIRFYVTVSDRHVLEFDSPQAYMEHMRMSWKVRRRRRHVNPDSMQAVEGSRRLFDAEAGPEFRDLRSVGRK